jgi:hypothetical protein
MHHDLGTPKLVCDTTLHKARKSCTSRGSDCTWEVTITSCRRVLNHFTSPRKYFAVSGSEYNYLTYGTLQRLLLRHDAVYSKESTASTVPSRPGFDISIGHTVFVVTGIARGQVFPWYLGFALPILIPQTGGPVGQLVAGLIEWIQRHLTPRN